MQAVLRKVYFILCLNSTFSSVRYASNLLKLPPEKEKVVSDQCTYYQDLFQYFILGLEPLTSSSSF